MLYAVLVPVFYLLPPCRRSHSSLKTVFCLLVRLLSKIIPRYLISVEKVVSMPLNKVAHAFQSINFVFVGFTSRLNFGGDCRQRIQLPRSPCFLICKAALQLRAIKGYSIGQAVCVYATKFNKDFPVSIEISAFVTLLKAPWISMIRLVCTL